METTAFLVEAVGILGKSIVCVVDRPTKEAALKLLSHDRKFKIEGESVFCRDSYTDKMCLLSEIVIKK